MEAGVEFSIAPTWGMISPANKKMFLEWNTSADGSGTGYNPEDIISMPASNLTLYAIWVDARAVIYAYDKAQDTVGTLKIRTFEPENTVIILAAYDSNGRLIKMNEYLPNVSGGLEQSVVVNFNFAGAASVKAFMWDKEFIPMYKYKNIAI